MSSKKLRFKDNNKTPHWVCQAKLTSLDTYDFSKEKFIGESQASLTSTTIEQSASGREDNPYLLQET